MTQRSTAMPTQAALQDLPGNITGDPGDPPEQAAMGCTGTRPAAPVTVDAQLLLESVTALTHLRDRNELDRCLVLSLTEMTGADHVQLHRHHALVATASHNASTVQCRRHPNQPLSISIHESCVEPALETALGRQPQIQLLADGHQRVRVPIFNESRLLATLLVDCPAGTDVESTQQLVTGFIRIYTNYVALLNESERDKLTGLYNRRTFERHLHRRLISASQLDTAVSGGKQVWVAIVDIDHFKRINDTFGHLYGDEVILLLTQRMRHSFDASAHLFRFGGEEFVILFNAPDETQAIQMLEHFRRKVADRPFPQVGAVSVSMGCCHIDRHDFPEAALDRADQALYYAKSHGRNQLHCYEKLTRCGHLKIVATGSIDLF